MEITDLVEHLLYLLQAVRMDFNFSRDFFKKKHKKMANSSKVFNQISTRLSTETNLQNQLAIVVEGAMDLTHSDAGTLYSLHDDQFLRFEVVMNRTLNIRGC